MRFSGEGKRTQLNGRVSELPHVNTRFLTRRARLPLSRWLLCAADVACTRLWGDRSGVRAASRRRHSHIYAPASAMEDPMHGGPPQSLLKVTVAPDGTSTSEARPDSFYRFARRSRERTRTAPCRVGRAASDIFPALSRC